MPHRPTPASRSGGHGRCRARAARTSSSADVDLGGAELATAPDGGILFGTQAFPGLRFGSTAGPVALDDTDRGTAWLAHYLPDGTLGFARTIPGTALGPTGEIARSGSRVYVDVVLRGEDNVIDGEPFSAVGKDASVWALDLRGSQSSA